MWTSIVSAVLLLTVIVLIKILNKEANKSDPRSE